MIAAELLEDLSRKYDFCEVVLGGSNDSSLTVAAVHIVDPSSKSFRSFDDSVQSMTADLTGDVEFSRDVALNWYAHFPDGSTLLFIPLDEGPPDA